MENWTYVANIELDIDGLKEKDVVMLECLGNLSYFEKETKSLEF